MRHLLAFTAVAVLAAGPALADGMGEASGARRSITHRHVHQGYRSNYGVRVSGYGFAAAGPGYGPEPPYFDGTGGASPSGGFGSAEVTLSLYREPYIGKGLVYNVPPQPFLRASNVISVRY